MVDEPAPDAAPEPVQALTPANQNPWYVLATLHGEQQGTKYRAFDKDVHAKNRLTWNRWASGALCEEQRRALRERHDAAGQRVYSEEELAPHTPKEIAAIKRRWRREWTRRNPSLPVAALPDPSQMVECKNLYFDNIVCWDFFIFPCQLNTDMATYSSVVTFKGASFFGGFKSTNANYIGGSLFEGVSFFCIVNFSDSNFKQSASFTNVIFSDCVWFSNAKFSSKSNFYKSVFDFAFFNETIFGGSAYFIDVEFRSVAQFRRTTFSGDAQFGSATFLCDAEFQAAAFLGNTVFQDATFSCDAKFENATISGDAMFQMAIFSGDASFENVRLQSSTSFARARFTLHPPRFHGASLHEGTEWHGVQWPPAPGDAEAAQRHVYAYERLKQEMERLKKHDDELQFFEREMRCRRMVEDQHLPAERLKRVIFLLKGDGWSGLLNRAYDCFSGYGRSILRPTLGLIATFVLGIAAMMQAACWPGRAGSCPAILTLDSPFIALKQATLLSFANMLAPLNVRKDFFDAKMLAELSGWLKIVGGLQTLLALGFAFLIGLALRNRFRLR